MAGSSVKQPTPVTTPGRLSAGVPRLGAIVVYDRPYKILGYQGTIPIAAEVGRLRAFRANLPGAAVSGSGCASSASLPQIAVRSEPGSSA